MKNKWTRFYINTNVVWGWIESREQWLSIIKNQSYLTPKEFYDSYLKCRQHYKIDDNFGFRIEHTGNKTLGEFLKENGNEYVVHFDEHEDVIGLVSTAVN